MVNEANVHAYVYAFHDIFPTYLHNKENCAATVVGIDRGW